MAAFCRGEIGVAVPRCRQAPCVVCATVGTIPRQSRVINIPTYIQPFRLREQPVRGLADLDVISVLGVRPATTKRSAET